ncbi:MAG: DinB family protein [Armatimonadetes bacterium]|nr:DinB family protein [Armatimonadota bacterium]
MDVRSALKGQYHGALATLKEALDRCPDDLWTLEGPLLPFWQVAYHALFFTHFYLQRGHLSFEPWEHHRHPCQDLSSHDQEPYAKAQILEYWAVCDGMVDGCVDGMDLEARECGFPWYPLPKLDHQIVNIRHIQHHAAQLGDRLRAATGEGLRWYGKA